jgi:hypothetical protein
MADRTTVKIESWRNKEIADLLTADIARRVGTGVVIVRDTIKKSINRGNLMRVNPSKPGEPPKKVSARLFNSIQSRVTITQGRVIGEIGTDVEYGPRLEFGFAGVDVLGRRYDQAPRPFMRPGLQAAMPAVQAATGLSFKVE